MRKLAALAALLALGACASFSTDPEAANPAVRRLCYVEREAAWVQIPAPENAQAYRDAWTRDSVGHEPFRFAYVAPRWPEDEFWFRDTSGKTKLCTGNPFHREPRCGAGTTVDFTEDAAGIVATSYNPAICIT